MGPHVKVDVQLNNFVLAYDHNTKMRSGKTNWRNNLTLSFIRRYNTDEIAEYDVNIQSKKTI